MRFYHIDLAKDIHKLSWRKFNTYLNMLPAESVFIQSVARDQQAAKEEAQDLLSPLHVAALF